MTPEELKKLKKFLTSIRTVAVFLGSRETADPGYAAAAAELGRFLAENDLTLIYGGAGVGTMKALADSVLNAGGKVIGVFPAVLSSKILHPALTEQISVSTISERKKVMLEKADCIVVLPGGIGTLDEFFSALEEIKRTRKPLGVLNVNRYYDHLEEFWTHANETGFISNAQRQAVTFHRKIDTLFYRMLGSFRQNINEEKTT